MKITKNHIGQEVILVPTGNSVDRYGEFSRQPYCQQLVATIATMKRTRGSFVKSDGGHTQEFGISDYSDDHIDIGANYGYLVFKDAEEIENHVKIEMMKRYLSSTRRDIPKETLLEAYELLRNYIE